ncbi:uncharacterized protein LOC143572294 [Bidens hawaiensis]|uniref:uncharacterized protein LOC143572294 n=1 Tax=Bidens hawaiensis TaxID=980011 RepID=UPI00404AB1C1
MTFFLSLKVEKKMDSTLIHQEKYVQDIVQKFGFKDSSAFMTSIATRPVLTPNPSGKTVDQHLYRYMIGSLMYLTTSRLDIMFPVCQCARYQSDPRESHMTAVKHNDYGGCNLDRKLTSGMPISGRQINLLAMQELHNLFFPLEWPMKKKDKVFTYMIKGLRQSTLEYAISANPTIYSKWVTEFWVNAKAACDSLSIITKVVGKTLKIIEGDIRRALKIRDEPDYIFEKGDKAKLSGL